MADQNIPNNLLEVIRYFSDPDVCIEFVASLRWLDGVVVCPHCEGRNVGFLKTRRIWKCRAKECRKQFSVKTGTIFEESPIALDKWLMAIWLVVNCKNGISSYEIHRDLKVTQKSAWFMLHRIRLALKNGSWAKMGSPEGGEVEVDEAYIGGVPKNMHKDRKLKLAQSKNGSCGVEGHRTLSRQDRHHGHVRPRLTAGAGQGSAKHQARDFTERDSGQYPSWFRDLHRSGERIRQAA